MVHFRLLLFLIFTLLLASCQRDEHSAILSKEEMAEVLYDYQLANALAAHVKSGDPTTLLRYRQAVFHKHHISEDVFKTSMVYYSRHTREMTKVYELVSQLNPNSEQQMVEDDTYPMMARGDTLTLWTKSHVTLLANRKNQYVVKIQPTETLKKEDELFVRFQTQWHYRQGAKSAVGILMVRYANDSVQSLSKPLYAYENLQQLQLRLSSSAPVKSVELQVYQQGKWEAYPMILQMNDLRLLKVSPKEQPSPAVDSTKSMDLDTSNVHLAPQQDTLLHGPKTFRRI